MTDSDPTSATAPMSPADPGRAVRDSTKMLREVPSLLAWALVSAGVQRVVWLVVLALLGAAIALAALSASPSGGLAEGLKAVGDAFSDGPRAVLALGALGGIALTAWFAALVTESAVTAGIAQSLVARLQGSASPEATQVSGNLTSRLPVVLGWRLVRVATSTALGLMGLAMLGLTLFIWPVISPASGSPRWPLVVAVALGWSAWLLLSLVVRLALAVAHGPIFVEGRGLGEALLESLAFCLSHLVGLYRVFIGALALMLVPLGLYWLAVMGQNLTLGQEVLEGLGTVARLVGEVVLFVGLVAADLVFLMATLVYFARQKGHIAPPSASPLESAPMTQAHASGAVAMVPGTRLQDLMPADSAPAPFDIAAVFEPATLAALQAAAHPTPKPTDEGPDQTPPDVPEQDRGPEQTGPAADDDRGDEGRKPGDDQTL